MYVEFFNVERLKAELFRRQFLDVKTFDFRYLDVKIFDPGILNFALSLGGAPASNNTPGPDSQNSRNAFLSMTQNHSLLGPGGASQL